MHEDNNFGQAGTAPDAIGAQKAHSPNGGTGAGLVQNKAVGSDDVVSAEAMDRECAGFLLSELGNAERFEKRFGNAFRFCHELGWFAWDGRRWKILTEEMRGTPAAVMRAAFATVRAIKNEAKLVRESGLREPMDPNWSEARKKAHAAENKGRMDFIIDASKNLKYSDKIAEWARSSESKGRIESIPSLAKNFERIVANVDDFDADRMAINCLNGTLRLQRKSEKRTAAEIAAGKSEWHSVWALKLHKHRREDLITKLTRVKYLPNAKAPIFDAFFAKVQPDPIMRRFITQWGGLSMTGDISEQKFAFFYGQGRNGKGTFVEALAWLAGDYAGSLPVESLLENGKRRGDQATPDIARLPGVRLLRISEPSKGVTLNEGLVKMLTGGDPVNARHLNKGIFTFLPEFKITISGNIKPTIKDTTDGIWRRLQLVPWQVTIPLAEIDRQLTEKLQSEAEGIFAGLMQGLLDWRVNGLIEPDEVRMATRIYRDDSDDLGRFLRQCCILGEDLPGRPFRIAKVDLYPIYEAWAKQSGGYLYESRAFTKAMLAKGFVSKSSNGDKWLGIIAGVSAMELNSGNWTALDEKEDENRDEKGDFGAAENDSDLDGYNWAGSGE